MNKIAAVTGAAGGIGLELCRQLLEDDYVVVAAPRVVGSDELATLGRAHEGRLHEIAMDIGNAAAVDEAARQIAERVEHIDVLFNNAGIYPHDGGLEQIDEAQLVRAFDINAVGPLRVTRALLPLLRRGAGKRVIQVTSLMGSVGDNGSGGSYAYRMSKAALNMANRNLAHELGGEGFFCLAVHPGWVKTPMGGGGAPLEPRAAVEQLLANALSSGREDNGGFKGPGGKSLPW